MHARTHAHACVFDGCILNFTQAKTIFKSLGFIATSDTTKIESAWYKQIIFKRNDLCARAYTDVDSNLNVVIKIEWIYSTDDLMNGEWVWKTTEDFFEKLPIDLQEKIVYNLDIFDVSMGRKS
jgi:hypothetical protein